MPVYEYYCSHCQNRVELMRSMSRSGEGAPCPLCQRESPRAISMVAVLARGEGGALTALAGGGGCGACAGGSCASCN